MKKFLIMISIIASIIMVSTVFIVEYVNTARISKNVQNNGFVGVVQTTQNSNISYICNYDSSLNFIGEKKIEYGDMGDDLRVPCLVGNKMYVVPLGLGNTKELKIVMEYDFKTQKYKTYDIGQQGTLMFCADAENKNIYTTNTFNFNGTIVKLNIPSGKLKTWKMKGVIMSGLKCYNNILYAWGTIHENNLDNPYLFIYNAKSLTLIKKISIKSSGSCQYDSCKIGDEIYFSNNFTTYQENQSNILSKFNIKTNTIENIKLKADSPYQILKYKDKLYISHCNPLFHRGNEITIYDIKTGDQKLVILKNALVQCIVYKNNLYSQDGENIYVYDMDKLKLIKKASIYRNRNTNMRFRIGGFFLMEGNL